MVIVALVSVGVIAVAGFPVFVRPQIDPLRRADVIVVLGGTPYERFDRGIELAQQGYAPEVLISQSTGADDPEMDRYCGGRFAFRVSCFVPDPWTTDGEAREIVRRAKIYGWRHIIVVTFTPHVSRARYIVEKCFDGEITMVASPSESGLGFWAWMYVRQSGGYVRAFVNQHCETAEKTASAF
ncbi:YdcF family protein [Nocardia camponoti]|uniref:YdcF family protein n=1 Tax=Nocardia camponoti TaxID=1616106 RepID=UPI001E64FB6B|nr:YdcF family protein [Nocardia camponoti]